MALYKEFVECEAAAAAALAAAGGLGGALGLGGYNGPVSPEMRSMQDAHAEARYDAVEQDNSENRANAMEYSPTEVEGKKPGGYLDGWFELSALPEPPLPREAFASPPPAPPLPPGRPRSSAAGVPELTGPPGNAVGSAQLTKTGRGSMTNRTYTTLRRRLPFSC